MQQPLIIGLLWLVYIFLVSLTPSRTDISLISFFSFPLAELQLIRFIPFSILTAIWVSFSAACVLLIFQPKSWSLRATAIGLAFCLLASFGWGFFKLSNSTQATKNKTAPVTVIQHNFSYADRDKLDLLPKMTQLAEEASKNNPKLIVFPLYSLAPVAEKALVDGIFFSKLSQKLKTEILIASRFYDPSLQKKNSMGNLFFVSAFLFNPAARMGQQQIYHSVDRSALHDPDQVLGKKYHLMDSGIGKLGVLLCYESVRSKWARIAKKEGAQLLIGLSNPADAEYSLLPYYHLRLDQIRAIETGLYFLRSTPNGFTALIDPQGRIKSRSNLRKEQILNFEVPIR